MKDAATYAIPDFVDIILAGGERADEAMYYLLHKRLNKQLKGKFVVYQHQLMDEFEDVVEDFFLYLREGKDGRSRTPYQSLQRIQKREAFESWMLSTFRNYLTMRADKEGQMTYTGLPVEIITDVNEPSSSLTDERKLAIVSHLIAFAHQVFYPHSRFIFLRSLLTILNKQQALPNEEMAKALGMTELLDPVARFNEVGLRALPGDTLRLVEERRDVQIPLLRVLVHIWKGGGAFPAAHHCVNYADQDFTPICSSSIL